MLTVERLRQIMDYDRETGVFTWRARPVPHKCHKAWNAQWAGKAVAVRTVNDPQTSGRKSRLLRIAGKYYGEHRVVWAYVTGEWPKDEIDHRNVDSIDNRFENLREATHGQNQRNKGAMRNNRLGVKGVYYDRARKKYVAQSSVRRPDGSKTTKMIGRYATLSEASDVYVNHAKSHHGEFLHYSLKGKWSTPTINESIIDPWIMVEAARCDSALIL